MGKGNANKEQEEDYWEDFDPKADNHENPLELPFPVDDPDFNYLKYNLSLKNIEDRVTAGKITGAEADELTAKLNNPFVPIIIIAIGAYIVSQPFFLVHR